MTQNGYYPIELDLPEAQVGPHYSLMSPTNMVGLGARIASPQTGLSTIAAQKLMSKLQDNAMRTAVETTDAVMAAIADAIDARWEELEQAVLQLPTQPITGMVSRDKVMNLIGRVRSRPARL